MYVKKLNVVKEIDEKDLFYWEKMGYKEVTPKEEKQKKGKTPPKEE